MYIFEGGGGKGKNTFIFFRTSGWISPKHDLIQIARNYLSREGAKDFCILGEGWLLLAKGRMDLKVLGNCMKCIDCDIRVSVVPPGALVRYKYHCYKLFKPYWTL